MRLPYADLHVIKFTESSTRIKLMAFKKEGSDGIEGSFIILRAELV